MPEVEPVKETSFQNMIDHEYSAKAVPGSVTPDFPNGQFGIVGGDASHPPRWTLGELRAELMREATTQVGNNRAAWKESPIQRLGIIQQTLNAYADVLMKIGSKSYQNAPDEWYQALERVLAG